MTYEWLGTAIPAGFIFLGQLLNYVQSRQNGRDVRTGTRTLIEKSNVTLEKQDDLHTAVDGRMQEMVQLVKERGELQGAKDQRQATEEADATKAGSESRIAAAVYKMMQEKEKP